MEQLRPSITEVVGRRVHLRKAGKEFVGRCPFHDDRNPSFSVSEEKCVFHCFGCGESGDVFDFIMKLDGLTFPEARAQLGIASSRPSPKAPDPVKGTAALIADWANDSTSRLNAQLRNIGRRERVARLAGRDDEVNLLEREWLVLEALAEDLQDETRIIELWQQREAIENLFEDLSEDFTPEEFPPLTPEYRAMLKSHVVEVAVE